MTLEMITTAVTASKTPMTAPAMVDPSSKGVVK